MKRILAAFLFLILNITPVQAQDTRKEQHLVVTQSWLAAIDMVAQRTGNLEARELNKWIKQVGVVAMPAGEKALLLEPTKPNQFTLIALLPGDEKESAVWRDLMNERGWKAQTRSTVIIFKAMDLGPTSKGLAGLHELYHAHYQASSLKAARDPQVRLQYELQAYEFGLALVNALGGSAYQELIRQEIGVIKLLLARNGKQLGEAIPVRGAYYRDLDAIWGPTRSSSERGFFRSQLRMAAYFRLLEQEYTGDLQQAKRTYIDFLEKEAEKVAP